MPSVGAAAQAAEPMVNTATPPRKVIRLPSRSPIAPPASSSAA
jgi:hypothetical protein